MMKWARLIAVASLALPTLTIAGCTDDSPSAPVGFDAPTAHVISADRGSLRAADFELSSGVTTLVLHSGDLGGHLYQVSTPVGAGSVPTAVLDGDHVVAQLSSSGTNGPSIVDIALSDAVAWTIHLDGGSTVARVDMHAGGLATLDFGAGVTRIDATVPGGAVSVRMSGGASEFAVHAPKGVPARVTMGGGSATATIDGQTHTGVSGGTVFTPTTWPNSRPHLDIDNTAGVSTFNLDRY